MYYSISSVKVQRIFRLYFPFIQHIKQRVLRGIQRKFHGCSAARRLVDPYYYFKCGACAGCFQDMWNTCFKRFQHGLNDPGVSSLLKLWQRDFFHCAISYQPDPGVSLHLRVAIDLDLALRPAQDYPMVYTAWNIRPEGIKPSFW